jgi:hypothetical protein
MTSKKNPWVNTMARELHRHLTRTRGWTDDQVREDHSRRYDRLGPRRLFRFYVKCHNQIVLRRMREAA